MAEEWKKKKLNIVKVSQQILPLAHFDGEESYNVKALKKCTHKQFLNQAEEVITAPMSTEEDRLAVRYGIKGAPLLSLINILTLPLSFPLNFMHFIFKNLWLTKGLDAGTKDYISPAHIWSKTCKTSLASGDTIPSQFGAWVLNLKKEHSHMTWRCGLSGSCLSPQLFSPTTLQNLNITHTSWNLFI